MNSKCTLLLVVVVVLSVAAAAADTAKPAISSSELMDKVAKIKVGSTTGAQVIKLLGPPWRSTNYGDCQPVDYQEIWEYVGRNADGLFRIHIEFDERGIAQIVARVPQKGPIAVLAATPKPGIQHQH